MTQPRCILPGSTYFITRRTLRRHHLLRPDAATNNLLVYALATCALRYGIEVHAFCVVSTHYHLVATDLLGRLPLFLAQLNRIIALTLKLLRRWEGPLWDHEQTSVVRLETTAAVIDKIAYCVSNPVAAGLVRHGTQWPGVRMSIVDRLQASHNAHRPSLFFKASNSQWPSESTLRMALPPSIEPEQAASFVEAVANAIDRHEAAAHNSTDAEGRRVMGAKQVLKSSPYKRTTSFEQARKTNPTFASGSVRGSYARAVQTLRAFRRAYRDAFEAWRSGIRTVLFPPGTWWMRECHDALVQTL